MHINGNGIKLIFTGPFKYTLIQYIVVKYGLIDSDTERIPSVFMWYDNRGIKNCY